MNVQYYIGSTFSFWAIFTKDKLPLDCTAADIKEVRYKNNDAEGVFPLTVKEGTINTLESEKIKIEITGLWVMQGYVKIGDDEYKTDETRIFFLE